MRRFVSKSLVVALLACGAWAGAAQVSASQSGMLLHIGVQARRLDGSPLKDLRNEDFQVTAVGRRFHVAAVQPATSRKGSLQTLPVHVLLVISAYSDYGSENAVAGLLANNLPETFGNMELAVLQRNSLLTRYCHDRQELIQHLRGFSNQHRRIPQALDELGTYPGRRAVMYFTEKGVNLPPSIRHKAEEVSALVYQIGGSGWQNYVSGGESGEGFAPGNYGNYYFGRADTLGGGVGVVLPAGPDSPVWTRSIRQVVVERTLKGAFRSLTEDGEGYYDLSVYVPEGVRSLDLKLNVKGDYQLSAQDYTEDHSIPPGIRLPTRQ